MEDLGKFIPFANDLLDKHNSFIQKAKLGNEYINKYNEGIIYLKEEIPLIANIETKFMKHVIAIKDPKDINILKDCLRNIRKLLLNHIYIGRKLIVLSKKYSKKSLKYKTLECEQSLCQQSYTHAELLYQITLSRICLSDINGIGEMPIMNFDSNLSRIKNLNTNISICYKKAINESLHIINKMMFSFKLKSWKIVARHTLYNILIIAIALWGFHAILELLGIHALARKIIFVFIFISFVYVNERIIIPFIEKYLSNRFRKPFLKSIIDIFNTYYRIRCAVLLSDPVGLNLLSNIDKEKK